MMLNTLSAEAIAFCNSATTPDISLKGFVYWFEYVKKLESCPMDNFPFIAAKAPATPTET